MTQEKDKTTQKLGFVTHLECLNCGEKYSLKRLITDQGTTMINICYDGCFGPLDVKYDYDLLKTTLTPSEVEKRDETFWRLKELLPVNDVKIPDRAYTPLITSKEIGEELGIRLYFKLDSHENNPTQSFKDRPVTLAFNKALETGYDTVYVASTGNLAISSAYHSKLTGVTPKVYIPETLGEIKKNAIRKYLPNPDELIELPCTYDETNIRAMEDCKADNEANQAKTGKITSFVPNSSFRPYYKEGSKTSGAEIAFQIKEELSENETLNLTYPLGSGALFCSAYKGICELKTLGLFDNPVKMWGVQPTVCSPIVSAIGSGDIIPVRKPMTIAKSIAIGNPGSGYQSLDVMGESGGGGWSVTEREILENTLELYQKEGIFCQFVGGTTLAGIKRGVNSGELEKGSVVVANITGTGYGRVEDDLIKYSSEYGLRKEAEQITAEVN